MTVVLVTMHGKEASEWARELGGRAPGLDLRGWPEFGRADEVEAVLSDSPLTNFGGFGGFPYLGWVHFLGHGVGDMLLDPSLPAGVTVTRQHRQSIARSLTLYTVQAITAHHLRVPAYRQQQGRGEWVHVDSPAPSALKVGVLGLGVIGVNIACRLRDLGYAVVGWSRSGRDIEGVDSAAGPAGLEALLPECDYIVGVLPETPLTTGLVDARVLSLMKPGAYLINGGRGSLIVEADLLEALDAGHIAGAALDVFATEPLPSGHRFWTHPKITLTPHTGGPAQDDAAESFDEIAENYRRFKAGEPLLNVVDRNLGY